MGAVPAAGGRKAPSGVAVRTENLRKDMREVKEMKLGTFADRLQRDIPGLRSVVLYGSAAAGDHTGRGSDYNLLLVVERLDMELLDRLSRCVRRWMARGNPPPVVFTIERLEKSVDVFPIEIADMKQARRVLWGEDVLERLHISLADLRSQLERELKQKIIALRQGYLAAAGHKRLVRRLMMASFSSVLTLVRSTLRLHQKEIPLRKMDAARMLREHVEFDLEVLETLYAIKCRQATWRGRDCRDLFRRYLLAVETIADHVDRWIRKEKEE
ncbi:MAG: hypothetical protein DRP22_00250 [Verrucomicrobia bacterium]|nr:MAG: hypothetical protein DRP22_00250 [Verrucomicrobiota bacterium]